MITPITLRTTAGLHRANCLAAALLLAEGTFEESDEQVTERRRLIAEIAATEKEVARRTAAAKTWVDRRLINDLWDVLWNHKVRPALVERGVKV